ncbi:MAG: hypothetical protein Q8J74_08770, partial [Candidatus Didemnitutus sp.]|nr:hypothetical protein [Candidatus Didemnitutus sp.]
LVSVNPATGKRLRIYRELTPRQVDTLLDRATEAFTKWRRTSSTVGQQVAARADAAMKRGAYELGGSDA